MKIYNSIKLNNSIKQCNQHINLKIETKNLERID